MIGRLLMLPFRLVKGILGLLFGSAGLVLKAVLGVVRFVVNHLFGTLFGAIVGFLLGRKHVGVKLFTGRKKG